MREEDAMFNNVLVGIDGVGGRDAIALADRMASAAGELTLAYVYHGDPQVWRGSRPPYDAAERESARDMLETAAREAGVHAQVRWHGSASVGRGLHDLAETLDADLLVVGSSRRGLVGRVLLGDHTHAALNGARCAVAIAPAGYAQRPHPMREIGVGYNASPESGHALKVARELASEYHARLSAFEVVSIPTYTFSAGPVPVDDWVQSLVEDARKRVEALDGVEPHAVYGRPAEELGLFSASVDLLVVGSRSYGPIGRLVYGSTSQQLARTARCPLLVLTRAARAAEMTELSGARETAIGAQT
jgi:nucleotide-binding universal stress UspA family protein